MAIEHIARMGVRIRQRREELGLTQEDVARSMPGKTTGNQVSRWERGANRPGDQQLEHLAKILKVDPAYFMAPATPIAPAPAVPAEPDRLALLEAAVARIEAKLDALAEAVSPTIDDAGLRQLREAAAQIGATKPRAQRRAPSKRHQGPQA